jgi:glycosyltransferase involved in cell wall biosynthesis
MVIDVIIPVRDVDRYLSAAVDSALNQNQVQTRVTVVDGGSINPVILEPRLASDSRVQLVRSEAGLTAGGGRNLGVVNTSAALIAFLDADDLWPANRCAALLECLHETEAHMATGLMTHFHSDEQSRHLGAPTDVKTALVAGGTLLSRTVFEQVGFYDELLKTGEYIEWHNRFKSLGLKEAVCQEVVLERRVHSESTTATQLANRNEYLTVVRRWMNQKN